MGQLSEYSIVKQGYLCLESHMAEIEVSPRVYSFLELRAGVHFQAHPSGWWNLVPCEVSTSLAHGPPHLKLMTVS